MSYSSTERHRAESPLRLDLTNILDEVVGPKHGLSTREMESWLDRLRDALKAVEAERLGFLDLPERRDLLAQVERVSEKTLGGIDTVVVLGIGGSALGPRAIFETAWGPFGLGDVGKTGGPARSLLIADNIDPDGFVQLLSQLDLKRTLFNVISKSGSTVETMAQLSIAWRELAAVVGEEDVRKHLAFTTDPVRGFLRETAMRHDIAVMDIPENVGGRFSVLTPVGLFPAMATGLDPKLLLDGAFQMHERCTNQEVESNPAALLALIHFLMDRLKGKSVAVMMPYSDRLKTFAEWFGQLWAESLGKNQSPDGEERAPVGQTPVRALGTTDQHSQIQLYTEGPNDKLLTLVRVEDPGVDVALGAPPLTGEGKGLAYLEGHSLGEVFRIEQTATEMALVRASRPTITWRSDSVGPHVLGQLFQVYEMATAIAGQLYNVDAFNQPGVEEGKNLTYGALGRAGYEEKGEELASYQNRAESWIVGGAK